MALWIGGEDERLEEAGRLLRAWGWPVAGRVKGPLSPGDHVLLPPAPSPEVPAFLGEGPFTLWGGALQPEAERELFARGWKYVAYGEDPGFRRVNGILTAESFLVWSMAEDMRTLRERRWAVLGLGYTGRPLVERILSWDGEVWGVTGRREAMGDLQAKGARILSWEAFPPPGLDLGAVVNTAPARLLTEAQLRDLEGVPFFDLASAPYGLDEGEAARWGLPYRRLPALPARVLTRSAARLVAEAVARLWPEGGGRPWERS